MHTVAELFRVIHKPNKKTYPSGFIPVDNLLFCHVVEVSALCVT